MKRLRALWRRIRRRFAKNAEEPSAPLGIFGAPNAGKSSLANAFCEDWSGEVLSDVSPVPHETRSVRTRQRLLLTDGTDELLVDVMDTPGLAERVTATDLEAFHGLAKEEALRRARDAIRGMLEAVKALERAEGILLVIDSTTDPLQQVNQVIVQNALRRRTPCIVVANKVDLPGADPQAVARVYGRLFPVVPVSAATRVNLDALYAQMFETFD